jgi:predicted HAD superfamily Cof-like phosphohydrolase
MYNDVKTFILACEQKRNESNVVLYKNLIREEFDEFVRAYLHSDEEGQLDGCMDLIWVILGFCYMKGYDVEGAWEEVARSNLSKIDPETGKVNKRSDGKVLKPENWTPPNLKSFTKKQ